MSNLRKTRNLSIYELFEILQKEYIICILRSKIYPYQKHKQYWTFVAEKKKEKILDIANRNILPNIFSSPEVKSSFEKHIYGENGFPKFIYRDDEHREKQEKWDYINYFSIGSEVKIIIEGQIKVGKVIRFDLQTRTVSISLGEKTMRLEASEVTRIL